jgi:signal transduction histidine kinase
MSPIDIQDIDVNALMRGLVHELRNPLSAILTASGLLNAGAELDEETAMLLDVVQKESKRMNRILLEFTAFAKPPAAHPAPFDFAREVRHVVADLTNDGVVNSKIEVRDELPEHLMANGDEVHIRRAMTAILENAAEQLERGGIISLHSVEQEEQVAIAVEDSGGGFGPGEMEQAFQPFFTTKSQSTGLGLSVARVAVRACGGDITLENMPGGGARVLVTLPLASPIEENVDAASTSDISSMVSSHGVSTT